MNSSKPIDISKSSLVSLKAELSRKQEEVSNFKANKASNYVCPIINPNKKPLPAVKSKFSKDVEKNAEDGSSSVAEENTKALDHSRNVLEIKSKLYDELKEGRLVSERGRGAEYLVDFTQKTAQKCDDSSSSRKEDVEEQSNSDEDDRPSDPEDDWVDYTDIVGRQRRCLRRDLPAMRAKDADSLLPPPPSPPPPPQLADCSEEDASAAQRPIREVPAAPPHIEAMRRQWRKQEEKLLDKDSVHYEDLLFNEARTHGVGYYAFSTDEAERGRQMRELERRREETLRRQSDAEGLRARRDAQLKARLQAAKARNRQRLGLPPLAPGEETEDSKDNAVPAEVPDENKTDDEKSKKEELEAALKRAAHIRPWDAEKLGLKIVGGGDQPAVMSQSEWVDMKREERISEFAPPQMYNQSRTDVITEPQIDDLSTPQPSESKTLFFTSKRPKAADFFKSQQQTSYQNQAQSSNQYRNEEQSREQYRTHEQSKSSDRFRDVDEEPVKRKRTEIPPPLTAEYFGGTGKPKHKTFAKISAVGESISEGLKYLDEQKKAKDHKRDKGLLDII